MSTLTRIALSLSLCGWLAACDGDVGGAGGDEGAGGGGPDAGGGGPGGACVVDDDCPAEAPLCSNQVCVAGCAGTAVTADFTEVPSDIIWVVDQSGSMDQETAHVQAQINAFASLIDASGIDFRVIMIADPQAENAICVPAPLGGPACGDAARFRLVPVEVDSHDGPALAIEHYPAYADFLRPEAAKHFVFVTDDESDVGAALFSAQLAALTPAGIFAGFKVHGIYAFGTPGGDGCDGLFGSGAGEGTVYTELIAQTGGAAGVICTGDWQQVFDDISAAVVAGSRISCELAIPAPPPGQSFDPGRVNLRYLPGGVGPGETSPRVDSAAACGAGGGWYYDDNAAPTTITLCPATCSAVQGDAAAVVQLELGCATEVE